MDTSHRHEEEEGHLRDSLQRLSADRDLHLRYFEAHLTYLPSKAEALHAQRLFLLYLVVTACDLLRAPWLPAHSSPGQPDDGSRVKALVAELRACYDVRTGGFHAVLCEVGNPPTDGVVSTHCAVHMLMVCGELRRVADTWFSRDKTIGYILRCQRADDGGFRSAPDVDDVDVRFTYAALTALRLLRTPHELQCAPQLRDAVRRGVDFVWRCWRPEEGGFAAAPHGCEVHGGMTFCAVASITLAGKPSHSCRPLCWEERVYRYAAHRLARSANREEDDDSDGVVVGWCAASTSGPPHASTLSGPSVRTDALLGFQGRPAKACDSCYTHWLGGVLGTLRATAMKARPLPVDASPVLRYVQACSRSGGPRTAGRGVGRHIGATPDLVHSCLGLSGALLVADLALSDDHYYAQRSTAQEAWQELQLAPPHPVFGCSRLTAQLNDLDE